jgi:hypothetical protein
MTGTRNAQRQKSPLKATAGKSGFLLLVSALCALAVSRGLDAARLAGAFLTSALLLGVLYKDIFRYKPQYAQSARRLLLLGSILAGTLWLAVGTRYLLSGLSAGLGFPLEATVYGLPVAVGAMLVVLLFDFHTALVFSFVLGLLCGLWLLEASYSVYVFVGSLVAAFSVLRCKRRTEILKGGLYLLGANVLAVSVLLLFLGQASASQVLFSLVFAAFSALLTTAIVSLALPLLEYLFGITTDISLLELLDLEHPLMKTMMVTAPGTYHHSIIVGNLVESAAEAVGVNPLLARVSAYYHDIGKIKMPEYFVENQPTGASKHERLTPHMSSMVLISHVKEGVELARQYKLPEQVVDIIRQHHGTSLITYFYQKAKEKAEELPEEEYKYPGPKPQSKVAALVMMADAVEAASRVLTEPTPARIAALVNKIINHIFLEGQLDECELTLKDIQEIKRRFVYILTGILHKRVDYPGFEFKEQVGEGVPSKQPAAAPSTGPKEGQLQAAQGPKARQG